MLLQISSRQLGFMAFFVEIKKSASFIYPADRLVFYKKIGKAEVPQWTPPLFLGNLIKLLLHLLELGLLCHSRVGIS